jgi:predicted dienelactone hydrolase
MIRRSLVVAVGAVLMLSCATSSDAAKTPKMPRAQYKGEVGDSPVGVVPDVVLKDAQRAGRDVKITIEYPTKTAGNPLILFSPGFGGSNRSYVGLSSYWASQGYVVIRVAHADAGKRLGENVDFWSTQTDADRRNRVRDLTLVLDSLESLETEYPELKGKTDATKVVVAGHSYGAYTALLVAGMKTFPGGTSYADPRVKAVVAMSPQGPGEARGLTRESFASINVPTLFMTGSLDRGMAESETPEWRNEAFELASPGDKWLMVVEHARHSTFIGQYDALIEAQAREREVEMPRAGGGFDPRNPTGTPRDPNDPTSSPTRAPGANANAASLRQRDIFGTIKMMALAFLDTYTKSDAKAREALEKSMTSSGVVTRKK